MIKITLEINDEVYSAKSDDVEKLKSFIDQCVDLEEKTQKAIQELKHF